MTDKQRLAVMVAMANHIAETSDQLNDEEMQGIEAFSEHMPIIFEAVTGIEAPSGQRDAVLVERVERDMERAVIEYLFAEMDYFKGKYVE